MRYANEIEKLETEIDRDEEKYGASEYLEREIIKTISQRGFAAACQRLRLLAEKQGLAERIRRNKIMLAWAKN
jgi:molybdenum cofactor biosynthesis enzyme MoaA